MEKTFDVNNLIDNLFDGVYFVDINRTILSWNSGAEQITGFSSNEVINKHCYENILNHVNEEGVALCFSGCPLHATMNDGFAREALVYLQHKRGHRIPVIVKSIPMYDEYKKITGAIEIFSEVRSESKLIGSIERYQKEASEDPLTKIPNRKYLGAVIESRIREYNAVGVSFGIAFIDIDNFKKINDSYGHDIGDECIKLLVRTIQSSLRKNDFIGRWGGEEFVVVFSGIDGEGLKKVTEKVRQLVESSKLRGEEIEVSITISIGATLVNQVDNVDMIVKRADELMYRSKGDGKNIVTLDI
jgi:diguanylate cyclase (GGDEF)-like protein/PAS domain S-box-containing protein